MKKNGKKKIALAGAAMLICGLLLPADMPVLAFEELMTDGVEGVVSNELLITDELLADDSEELFEVSDDLFFDDSSEDMEIWPAEDAGENWFLDEETAGSEEDFWVGDEENSLDEGNPSNEEIPSNEEELSSDKGVSEAESQEDVMTSEEQLEKSVDPETEGYEEAENSSDQEKQDETDSEAELNEEETEEKESETEDKTHMGECGALPGTVTWEMDETGTLCISGEGAMLDFASPEEVPWAQMKEDITSIVIAEGVTSIGAFSFCNCTAVTELDIRGSINYYGTFAFRNCSGLMTLRVG